MTSITKHKCDVCGRRGAVWGNRHLLGADDKLCSVCFELWYECGVTDEDRLRQRSLELEEA